MLASRTSRLYSSLMEEQRIAREAQYDRDKKTAAKLIQSCKDQLAIKRSAK